MKRGPRASTILTRSIEDIEAGHWCKGDLTCPATNEIDQYGSPDYESGHAGGSMGCALGLVAMYGGYGREVTTPFYFTGGQRLDVTYFLGKYPDGNAPSGVQQAVLALFNALPRSKKPSAAEFAEKVKLVCGDEIEAMNEYVIGYNDSQTCTKVRAATWFRKALELL